MVQAFCLTTQCLNAHCTKNGSQQHSGMHVQADLATGCSRANHAQKLQKTLAPAPLQFKGGTMTLTCAVANTCDRVLVLLPVLQVSQQCCCVSASCLRLDHCSQHAATLHTNRTTTNDKSMNSKLHIFKDGPTPLAAQGQHVHNHVCYCVCVLVLLPVLLY
jgi:hypothetical protein